VALGLRDLRLCSHRPAVEVYHAAVRRRVRKDHAPTTPVAGFMRPGARRRRTPRRGSPAGRPGTRRAGARGPGARGPGRAAGAARAGWRPPGCRQALVLFPPALAGLCEVAPGEAGKAAGGQRLTGSGKQPFFLTSFANPFWSISTRGEGWLGKVRVPCGVSQAPWGTPQGWRSDTRNPQQASGNYREVTTGYQLQERLGTPHQSLGGWGGR